MSKASKERKPSVVLTPKMKHIADKLLDGIPNSDVAKELGVTRVYIGQTAALAKVRTYMGNCQDELQKALQIHRGDIVIALLETAGEAKRAADHATMVRAYTEVAKMLGLYAPEVKEVHITTNQRAILSKYEAMTDEELLRLTEKEINPRPETMQ